MSLPEIKRIGIVLEPATAGAKQQRGTKNRTEQGAMGWVLCGASYRACQKQSLACFALRPWAVFGMRKVLHGALYQRCRLWQRKGWAYQPFSPLLFAAPVRSVSSSCKSSSQQSSAAPWEELIKPEHYLKQFYMRVHPDLLPASCEDGLANAKDDDGNLFSSMKEANSYNLAKFNGILDYASAIDKGPSATTSVAKTSPQKIACPQKQVLHFFCAPRASKDDEDRDKSKSFEGAERETEGNDFTRIHFRFVPPSRQGSERQYVRYFISRAVVSAGVRVDDEVLVYWDREFAAFMPQKRGTRQKLFGGDSEKAMIAEFRSHFACKRRDPKTSRCQGTFETSPHLNLMADLHNHGLLRFSPKLTSEQRMKAAKQLNEAFFAGTMEDIRFSSWRGFGIYVSEQSRFLPPVKGFFIIPAGPYFSAPRFYEYLQHHSARSDLGET